MVSQTAIELKVRRDAALGHGAPLFYDTPVHIVRGEGVHLYDPQGRRYVDLYNNVPCVGHGNPAVAAAMSSQQATLNVHSRYLHEGIVELAERLTGLYPEGLDAAVFACSGTEANEVALRAARLFTGRKGIICTNATYHGHSELVGSLTHLAVDAGHSNLRSFPFPDRLREPEQGMSEAEQTEYGLEALDRSIAALQAEGDGVAALIVCSIMANEGLPRIPQDFMARAAERVRAAGGLVIADEVQAGYARSGNWWGFETSGFEPDLAVTGKPMGNGLPLAATVGRRDVIECFRERTRYFNTFASSPLQAAVGLAVIDEIERMGLVDQVARVGGGLLAELKRRMGLHERIADVRGHGLFLGLEMAEPGPELRPDAPFARRVANALKDEGFLAGAAGAYGNVLKIRPPLVFADEHASAFLAAFDAVMGTLGRE